MMSERESRHQARHWSGVPTFFLRVMAVSAAWVNIVIDKSPAFSARSR